MKGYSVLPFPSPRYLGIPLSSPTECVDAGELKQKKICTNHMTSVEVRELTFTKPLDEAATILVGGAQRQQQDSHCSNPRAVTCWKKQCWY